MFFCCDLCLLSQSRPRPLPHPFLPILLGPGSSPCALSIRLQWAITALWGVDTFSCSSICGVVINFLSTIGLSYNILRLKAACSPCNQSRNQHRITISLVSSWIIQSSCDPKRPDSVTDKYYENMRLICMLQNVSVCLLRSLHELHNYTPQNMQAIKTSDSPGR